MESRFKVDFLPEARAFIESLDENVSRKIYYNIRKSQERHDPELFKKLNQYIWEFRTLYNDNAYRLFAFWDKPDSLVIATHGIIKKTNKTPTREIERAENIRRQYLNIKYGDGRR